MFWTKCKKKAVMALKRRKEKTVVSTFSVFTKSEDCFGMSAYIHPIDLHILGMLALTFPNFANSYFRSQPFLSPEKASVINIPGKRP